MESLSTSFRREDHVEFLMDTDPSMAWIGSFDSSRWKRFVVVIDERVQELYGERLKGLLGAHGKEILTFEVRASEESKSLEFYPKVVDFFEDHRVNRYDLVLAIGGGVVTDLVSFVVSTYMRGLPLITIPTTLIGQIDAATAGKTCLNTRRGKNVLGTFYYPLISYSNVGFLKTNEKYFLRQGFSEMFKYGLLGSKKLVRLMEEYGLNPSDEVLIEMMKLAVGVRIKVRKKDALVSNLGHTFGHAIEKLSKFEVAHGDAISAGTVIALYFAEQQGVLSRDEREKIVRAMKKIGLNVYVEKSLDVDAWVDAMMRDKKSSVDSVHLVLIEGVGKPYEKSGEIFFKTTPSALKDFLRSFMASYEGCREGCAGYLKRDVIAYEGESA